MCWTQLFTGRYHSQCGRPFIMLFLSISHNVTISDVHMKNLQWPLLTQSIDMLMMAFFIRTSAPHGRATSLLRSANIMTFVLRGVTPSHDSSRPGTLIVFPLHKVK